MEHFFTYAGGEFVQGHPFTVINPYDGTPVGQAFYADEAIYEMAVRRATESRTAMKRLSSFARYEILSHVARRLHEESETLSLILAREAAKPIRYARAEVARSVHTFIEAAEESKRIPGEYLALDRTPAGLGRQGWVNYFPAGTVAGISPFNFPLNLAVHKIAPAIAAGCPIVLKPASATPLSTLFLARILAETSLPPGAVSILPMNRTFADRMVSDSRFALLSFTGSPDVGWGMKSRAGKKKVLLELGGNAAAIITETADIKHAVARSLWGAWAYQGQVCIHAQRFLVHERVMDQFTEELVEETRALKIGAPEEEETEFTCMIDRSNADRIVRWTEEACSSGAELLTDLRRAGNLVHPIILRHAAPGMQVYDEEVFGPVITITPYTDFRDAVREVNDSRFGLQMGLFTDRQSELDFAFCEAEVGGVILNDVPTLRYDSMPYGGVKDSGMGREGVKYAMMEMSEPKILVK
jgi:glyceraldehyde-3-phosphate dehydrogenase (NADP+)